MTIRVERTFVLTYDLNEECTSERWSELLHADREDARRELDSVPANAPNLRVISRVWDPDTPSTYPGPQAGMSGYKELED